MLIEFLKIFSLLAVASANKFSDDDVQMLAGPLAQPLMEEQPAQFLAPVGCGRAPNPGPVNTIMGKFG